MSYEERDNGTHAVMCDTQGCKLELLAPDRDGAFSDASLAGWVSVGEDEQHNELHACGHCSRGQHPATNAIKQMLGGKDTFDTQAPYNVQAGDECKDDAGNVIGKYQVDAVQGGQVEVKLELPKPEKPTQSRRAQYREMMEGSSSDYDGIRSVVAPSAPAPTPVLATGTAQINQQALAEAEAAFGSLANTWDPDDDNDL